MHIIESLILKESDNWKNVDILEASTMFKELVHCILFNPLKSKQFHKVGTAITVLHVKKLRLINLTSCVPNHIAKFVLVSTLDHEPSGSIGCIFSITRESLLGEDCRLAPVTVRSDVRCVAVSSTPTR